MPRATASGYRCGVSVPLLGCLRGARVVPGPGMFAAPGARTHCWDGTGAIWPRNAGCRTRRSACYSDQARLFLSGRKESSLAGLTAAEVTAFRGECRKCRRGRRSSR